MEVLLLKKRKELAYSIDQRDIIKNLKGTPYNEGLNGVDDPEISYAFLLQYIFYLAKKNWTGNPVQIGNILEYLFFKEMELRNLIIITYRGQENRFTNRKHKQVFGKSAILNF